MVCFAKAGDCFARGGLVLAILSSVGFAPMPVIQEMPPLVHVYQDTPPAPVTDLCRRLKTVVDLLSSIRRNGISLSLPRAFSNLGSRSENFVEILRQIRFVQHVLEEVLFETGSALVGKGERGRDSRMRWRNTQMGMRRRASVLVWMC